MINKNVNIVDLSSINSIIRMQIEAFVLIFYILYDDITKPEKEFRYDIYKLHGLLKQSRFKTKKVDENIISNKKKIYQEIEEVKTRIHNSKYFIQASDKIKTQYLDPPYSKLIKGDILFKKCKLERTIIRDIWDLYSSYAHSEHISDRQYNAIFNKGAIDIDIYS